MIEGLFLVPLFRHKGTKGFLVSWCLLLLRLQP